VVYTTARASSLWSFIRPWTTTIQFSLFYLPSFNFLVHYKSIRHYLGIFLHIPTLISLLLTEDEGKKQTRASRDSKRCQIFLLGVLDYTNSGYRVMARCIGVHFSQKSRMVSSSSSCCCSCSSGSSSSTVVVVLLQY